LNSEITREIKTKEKTFSKRLIDAKNNYMINNFKKSIFPNSIVFVIISNLDYNNLVTNENFIDFFKLDNLYNIKKRLYKIKSNQNEVSNWLSYFSGMKPELTGINGNLFDYFDEKLILDSVFYKMKEKNMKNKVYGKKRFFFCLIFFVKLLKLYS